MYVTNSEAQQRFCCQNPQKDRCIGSQCMAWVWKEDNFDENNNVIHEYGNCGLVPYYGINEMTCFFLDEFREMLTDFYQKKKSH